MSENPPRPRPLTSWKEIADYLGVTVRTAQRWEKERKLPVWRPPGGRGQVSASITDLQNWKLGAPPHAIALEFSAIRVGSGIADRETGVAGGVPDGAPLRGIAPPVGRKKIWRLAAGIAATALIVGALFFVFRPRTGPPSHWHVEPDGLAITDMQNRICWRMAFPEDAVPQVYDPNTINGKSHVWMGDLDGDGKVETLINVEYSRHGAHTGELLCNSERGELLWRFAPGESVHTSQCGFSNDFSVLNFAVMDAGAPPNRGVLFVATNDPEYPAQVGFLSAQGVLLRDYWHSGYIGAPGCLIVSDLNGDGSQEVWLGGTSKAHHQATLVVLDPARMQGASLEDDPKFQLHDFRPGNEIARILFPRTRMNLENWPYNSVVGLALHDRLVSVEVAETLNSQPATIHYSLDGRYNLISAAVSDMFLQVHKQMMAAAKLKHEFTAAEEAGLRRLRYLKPANSTTRAFY
jgi:excisionase family DNA binding protein